MGMEEERRPVSVGESGGVEVGYIGSVVLLAVC